jgi:hypothetical protein
MEAELQARVDDRLPERIEGAIRVLHPLDRIRADEHGLEATLGDTPCFGDGGLDVGERQRGDRDQPTTRPRAVVVEHPVVVDAAHGGRDVREERPAGEHVRRIETARETPWRVLNSSRSRPSSAHDGASRIVWRSRSAPLNTRSSGIPIAHERPMLSSMSFGLIPPCITGSDSMSMP